MQVAVACFELLAESSCSAVSARSSAWHCSFWNQGAHRAPTRGHQPPQVHLSLAVVLFTNAHLRDHLVGVLFGIVPALQAARTDVSTSLDPTHGALSGRRLLVVSKLRLACVLLVGGGFMMKSLIAVLKSGWVSAGSSPHHEVLSLPQGHDL